MTKQRAALLAGFIFAGLLFVLSLAVFDAKPASAQFADQATYAGAGAGTANAQTITVPNASTYADLTGVILKYIPAAGPNTGATTLTVNGFGSSPSFRKPSGSGVTALIGGEIQIGQPIYVMYDGTFFNIIGPVTLPVGSPYLQNSALGFDPTKNLQINATVNSNNLTIALKGNNGSDASATNPILIPFRDSTIANGGPKIVALQAALSFTINSGNTMGCVSGQMCRLWVVAICSTGLECTNSAGSDVVGLCAFNALSGSSIGSINEGILQTSASGTNGGSSAQTYYCNIASVTGRAIRILGYVEVQEAAAGTWASAPTYVQLFGPGIKKPGDVVQGPLYFSTSSDASCGSAAFASTNVTGSITPTSAANLVKYSASGTFSITNANTQNILQMFRGSTGIGAGLTALFQTAGEPARITSTLIGLDVPNSTSAQTYVVKCNSAAGGAATFPTTNGGNEILEEIMGALEPANDNDLPMRMVG